MFSCAVGRKEHCKQISLACVGSACSVWATLGLPLLMGVCTFSVYATQVPGCSAGELSKAGPGLRALPRSKPLRFRFSGTPQRHRLSWACVPFLGLSRRPGAWQAHTPQVGRCILSRPLYQPVGFLGAQWECFLRCAVCLLWGADLRL